MVVRVLVVGSGPEEKGGIATVIRLMNSAVGCYPDVELTSVVTHRDGSLGLRLRVAALGIVRAFRHLLLRRADVVHVHVSYGGSVARKGLILRWAELCGVPSVVHTHGSRFTEWFDSLSPRRRRVVRWLLRGDLYLVLGKPLAAEYEQRLSLRSEQLLVLPNPVSWPEEIDRSQSGPRVTAIFLGRFGQRKGIYDLLNAAAALSGPVRAKLSIVIAGDGEVEQVRTRIAELELESLVELRTWLSPERRDALLAEADILLLPSYHEGLPMALLEGMAFHLAPVVTPVGGIADVVADGFNGLLVTPGDCPAITRAIERLVEDDSLRGRLADAARSTAHGYALGGWMDRLVVLWQDMNADDQLMNTRDSWAASGSNADVLMEQAARSAQKLVEDEAQRAS